MACVIFLKLFLVNVKLSSPCTPKQAVLCLLSKDQVGSCDIKTRGRGSQEGNSALPDDPRRFMGRVTFISCLVNQLFVFKIL